MDTHSCLDEGNHKFFFFFFPFPFSVGEVYAYIMVLDYACS